jgi:GNAT superfamily N-acetyltransferase
MVHGTAYTIRPSLPSDTEDLGRVHAQAWRETYGGIFPSSILEKEGTVEARTLIRKHIFAASNSKHAHFLVEKGDHEIVGFCDCGPAREADLNADAEIMTLYLLQTVRGLGLGTKLLSRMFDHLYHAGFGTAAARVPIQNKSARQFYARCGGHFVGDIEINWDGTKFLEAIYFWNDIHKVEF